MLSFSDKLYNCRKINVLVSNFPDRSFSPYFSRQVIVLAIISDDRFPPIWFLLRASPFFSEFLRRSTTLVPRRRDNFEESFDGTVDWRGKGSGTQKPATTEQITVDSKDSSDFAEEYGHAAIFGIWALALSQFLLRTTSFVSPRILVYSLALLNRISVTKSRGEVLRYVSS